MAVGKLGISIHDRLLVKKLLTFLSSFQAVAAKDQTEMVRKLELDSAYGRKVGEHVIELLDRIESHLKPRMVALVFKAYASSNIDGSMLHRLNSSIERSLVRDSECQEIQRCHWQRTPRVQCNVASSVGKLWLGNCRLRIRGTYL